MPKQAAAKSHHITTITASSITTMTRFAILVAVATALDTNSAPVDSRVVKYLCYCKLVFS